MTIIDTEHLLDWAGAAVVLGLAALGYCSSPMDRAPGVQQRDLGVQVVDLRPQQGEEGYLTCYKQEGRCWQCYGWQAPVGRMWSATAVLGSEHCWAVSPPTARCVSGWGMEGHQLWLDLVRCTPAKDEVRP